MRMVPCYPSCGAAERRLQKEVGMAQTKTRRARSNPTAWPRYAAPRRRHLPAVAVGHELVPTVALAPAIDVLPDPALVVSGHHDETVAPSFPAAPIVAPVGATHSANLPHVIVTGARAMPRVAILVRAPIVSEVLGHGLQRRAVWGSLARFVRGLVWLRLHFVSERTTDPNSFRSTWPWPPATRRLGQPGSIRARSRLAAPSLRQRTHNGQTTTPRTP